MADIPIRIVSNPGIKRDGTLFEGDNYVDALWCRFNRGLPRKIGGYQSVTSIAGPVRGLTSFSLNNVQYLHGGSDSVLSQVKVNPQGIFIGTNIRTPAGFVTHSDYLWQFETMYNSVSGLSTLLAHPGRNLDDISNSVSSDIYYGQVDASGVLVAGAVTDPESGGIVAVPPYLLKFGNAGRVGWSVPNKPIDFSGAGSGVAWVTGQKIVRGMPLRGTGSGPSALLWSLDSLVRATFNSTTTWAFDTLSGETSVLSSQGFVEYDGVYYWAGVDRFLMFNGVVREVPNTMNQNWFFDNLNYTYRQKVFAFKIPRWGEIWWCYPRGTATECTHAVIYNVRENTWYDTELPSDGRTAGVFAKVYNKPFMMSASNATGNYRLWQHESGVDSIDGSDIQPIPSYFETAEITLLTGETPTDKSMRISRLEQDFVQVGDMTLTLKGRANARSDPDQSSGPYTFTDLATQPSEQTIPLKTVDRLLRFKFESNTIGGDYQMGHCIAHIGPADSRVLK